VSGPLRIGIAGANAERGWALDAHLTALKAVPGYQIAAVSARNQDLADAAAKVFGAARAFGDTLEMVRDSGVDLVVVTIKVPEHRAVVLAALAAGKHVYCEWPLGRDLAEAEEMCAAVPASVHAVTGLQGLHAPAIRHAAKLVREGAIGRPLSLSVFSSAGAWGTTSPRHYAYLQDKRNGATLETIGGGHVLPLIEALVGNYSEVDARNSILHKQVTVQGTDETVERTCADHMFVLGLHQSGCVSSLEIVGGSPERSSLFELQGEKGWLRLVGQTRGTAQIAPLAIEASVPVDPLPASVAPELAGPSANVAELYAALLADLRNGTRTTPDFVRAVRLTKLLDAIDVASDEGRRQAVSA
jgi:predicted dehydrogenase